MNGQSDNSLIGGHEAITMPVMSMLPLVAALFAISFLATYLARKKGYSGSILIWAWIPVLNVYGLVLFAGLPSLFVRARMDALAVRLAPPAAKSRGRQPERNRRPIPLRTAVSKENPLRRKT